MNYQISQKGLVLNISNIQPYEARSSIIRDKSRYGNDGTIYGARFKNFAKYGHALSFDGVDDYVNCGNDTSLDITNTSFTLESIIKPAYISNWGRYSIMATYNPGWIMDLINDNNVEGYRFYDGSGAYVYYPPGGQISLEWTHFVFSRNITASELKMYLNGKEKQSWNMFQVQASTNPLWIGRRSDGLYFNGLIGEVRIYNRALSADEVRNNMYASRIYLMQRGIREIKE